MKVKKSEINESDSKDINIVLEKFNKNKKYFIIIFLLIIIFIINMFLLPSKERTIKNNVKSSLDRIVEKSNLETVNITYNVIAKECKNNKKCDKTSNKIEDFKYVVSCKGTITAGIDFSKIEIEVDEKEKKLIVTMPEASMIDEPNIGSIQFLNGEDLSANELPNARKLCQLTTKEKSEKDKKLLPAAKEQAKTVLHEFYEQWLKIYDPQYKVEVR